MSTLACSPTHVPTLMAIAGLYKARGMLDEARTALHSALQVAEAVHGNGSSSAGSSAPLGSGSGRGASALAAASAAAAAAMAATGDVPDADAGSSSESESGSPGLASGSSRQDLLQLQSQPSNDSSALTDMSTSSSDSDSGSNDSPAAAADPASAAGASAAAAAAAVPLASVKEALAVVLTDLGTRAKNAGGARLWQRCGLHLQVQPWQHALFQPGRVPQLLSVSTGFVFLAQHSIPGVGLPCASPAMQEHTCCAEHRSGAGASAAVHAHSSRCRSRTTCSATIRCTTGVCVAANCTALTGRASECESLYRQALALCPTYPSAHYNLGVLASESRRWLDALQHYKDTLALAPHHAQVRGVVACVMRTPCVCVCVSPTSPGVCHMLACAHRGLPWSPACLKVSCILCGCWCSCASWCWAPHVRPICVCAVQALCNSGVVYRELDRLEEAVAAYKDALAVSEPWPAPTGGVLLA